MEERTTGWFDVNPMFDVRCSSVDAVPRGCSLFNMLMLILTLLDLDGSHRLVSLLPPEPERNIMAEVEVGLGLVRVALVFSPCVLFRVPHSPSCPFALPSL